MLIAITSRQRRVIELQFQQLKHSYFSSLSSSIPASVRRFSTSKFFEKLKKSSRICDRNQFFLYKCLIKPKKTAERRVDSGSPENPAARRETRETLKGRATAVIKGLHCSALGMSALEAALTRKCMPGGKEPDSFNKSLLTVVVRPGLASNANLLFTSPGRKGDPASVGGHRYPGLRKAEESAA